MVNKVAPGTKRIVVLLSVTAMSMVMLASAKSPSVNPGVEHEKLVRDFVEAFNSRDLDQMLQLADENIQWMTVNGAKVTIETEGKVALRESMGRYFKSCPSCKSSLEWVQKAGGRITAMERASWTGKNGPKSQRSLSVYEFNGDKILRVYYFPADIDQ